MSRGPMPSDSPYYVANPDRSKSYRFITCADTARMGRHLMPRGNRAAYTIERGRTIDETKALAVKLGFPEECVKTDRNWIQVNTSVLASIPRDEAMQRLREAVREQRNQLSAVDDAFYERFEGKRGMKAYKREVEELDDRKQFETNPKPFLSMSKSPR